jgi:hypothetical protein
MANPVNLGGTINVPKKKPVNKVSTQRGSKTVATEASLLTKSALVKLTPGEFTALRMYCASHGTTNQDLIRSAILKAIK